MGYKVNDKVNVKKNLKVGQMYGKDRFVKYMKDTKVITIKAIEYGEYVANENGFSYTDEMIDGVVV